MGGPFYTRPNLEDLESHPAFREPKVPNIIAVDSNRIIDYVTEYIAQVISPSPQTDEEDVEMACVDIAKLIRTSIRKKLKRKLKR